MHYVKNNKLILNKWMKADKPNSLPSFATHNVGAGGIVFNDKMEILVVQENSGNK
jgi:hypothetical protein